MAELLCEACRELPAKSGDILCADCSQAYVVLLDLLRRHPELGKEDFSRLENLFAWRNKREQEWFNKIFQNQTDNVRAELQRTR